MRGAVGLLILLLASACRTAPLAAAQDALLTESSAATRAHLARSASALLGGVPVLLADDAFMVNSQVSIDRAMRRDAAGLRVDGRSEGFPKLLRLQIRDGSCLLRLEGSDRELALDGVNCRPAALPR
ncbi:hypothetical protein OPU71_05715 [Niveibacterium sp. 24ML]|uniref:hypothetical protein n=1 Tax=Niveibacterium sp. 24ML TaxID=2985512 RepID=UPI002270F38A|nr:hypothetical protein [Niveibacterium sp. 24ML]MCX9155619.1 hypothetical protein [Niveibacterium sp. 24ML]